MLTPVVLAPVFALLAVFPVQQSAPSVLNKFKFSAGQSVYVVAVRTTSRDLSLTRADLELERLAKNEFKKAKKFKIASALKDSDFVFFVLYDSGSSRVDQLALAVLPADYGQHGANLDAMRTVALWQGDGHYKVGRDAALVGATMGLSALFHRPSVVRDLVKQFHKDVF
jgi:hypothetical protein